MIRILCIAALLAAVGAHHDESWKHSMKRFFDTLNHDLDTALRKHGHATPKAPYSSTPTPSSTTPHPASGCSSSTASSTYQPTSSTAADCEPTKSTTESSTYSYPVHVGSIRGIPGVNFPEYADIPLTSFSCSDKDYIPGFYADMETGCQVFHVCWPHRRESFLCPLGTIFNQALLACDYWYSSNCSLASIYYNVNSFSAEKDSKKDASSMVDILLGAGEKAHSVEQLKDTSAPSSDPDAVLSFISQFLPVKAKVTVYPESADSRSKIVATASVGKVKHKDAHYGKHTRKSSTKKMQSASTTDAPETKYLTQAPETFTQSYAEVEQAVKLILNEVFQIVQNVIKDVPRYLDSEKPARPNHKHLSLTKLDPRFVVEPIAFPEKVKPSDGQTPGDVKSSKSTDRVDPVRKPLEEMTRYSELKVSPITKTALTTNYLRLLKIRKA